MLGNFGLKNLVSRRLKPPFRSCESEQKPQTGPKRPLSRTLPPKILPAPGPITTYSMPYKRNQEKAPSRPNPKPCFTGQANLHATETGILQTPCPPIGKAYKETGALKLPTPKTRNQKHMASICKTTSLNPKPKEEPQTLNP